MLAAYRGYSVILFAPIAALGAVLLTDPGAVGPALPACLWKNGRLCEALPVFLLGAVFGKLIELSGFSRSIVAAAIRILGRRHAIPVIVLVCALLTYGGCRCLWWPLPSTLSPPNYFARADPKRLIPATVALGAFSFTMDALPGTPQIQNIIPPASSAPTPGRPGWGLSARCSLSSSVCCGWSVSAAKRRPAAKAMGPTCKMSRRPG